MKIYNDIDLKDFTPWAGAKTNFELMLDEELDAVQSAIEEIYPNGLSETELNDILWFDDELIANCCGYESYDEFWDSRKHVLKYHNSKL